MLVGNFCYFKEFHALNIIFSVLGVDLGVLIQREFGDNPPPGAIPSMLETCFREVESRGLPEVGICKFGKRPAAMSSLRNFDRPHRRIDSGDQWHQGCAQPRLVRSAHNSAFY